MPKDIKRLKKALDSVYLEYQVTPDQVIQLTYSGNELEYYFDEYGEQRITFILHGVTEAHTYRVVIAELYSENNKSDDFVLALNDLVTGVMRNTAWALTSTRGVFLLTTCVKALPEQLPFELISAIASGIEIVELCAKTLLEQGHIDAVSEELKGKVCTDMATNQINRAKLN